MDSLDDAESMVFGTLLKHFRSRVRLTQETLAHGIGKHNRASIVAWENGLYLPNDREIVLVLAKELRLSESETDKLLLAAHFPPQFQALRFATEQTIAMGLEDINRSHITDFVLTTMALPPHIP